MPAGRTHIHHQSGELLLLPTPTQTVTRLWVILRPRLPLQRRQVLAGARDDATGPERVALTESVHIARLSTVLPPRLLPPFFPARLSISPCLAATKRRGPTNAKPAHCRNQRRAARQSTRAIDCLAVLQASVRRFRSSRALRHQPCPL